VLGLRFKFEVFQLVSYWLKKLVTGRSSFLWDHSAAVRKTGVKQEKEVWS
jgi:hypothetical protein